MPSATPLATYRLQLSASFDFDAATAVVPYLKTLGITHVYASPFLKARAGSAHGYDIVDHTKFNPELGGEDGFARLSDALRRHDMGLILDFVPNHAGVHFADNAWWLDMLEWGPSSPYAAAFDVDWDQLPHRSRGGILLPILGSAYGDALEGGEIILRYDGSQGAFSAWYYEHRLPIAPQRYGEVLRMIVKEADAQNDSMGSQILAFCSRYEGLNRPSRMETPAFRAELGAIVGTSDIIERGLEAYRAGRGRSQQNLALHHLLERQHYRIAHWRLAASDINYRRFFDINTLAGLRVEDNAIFQATHHLVRKLVTDGQLQGLRIDHIDGLHDPAQYCQRLKRLIRGAQGDRPAPFYVVIEKILGEGEKLPRFTGVHGTTGYEVLNTITRVLMSGDGLKALEEIWRQSSNQPPRLEPVLRESKSRVLETLLTSEFTVLLRLLARIASGHYSTRDYSADSLRQALQLYVLNFPVYRTYLTPAGVSAADRELISQTIERARAEWFAADEGIFDFLRDAITMNLVTSKSAKHSAPRVRRFAMKLQQFTGPLMAKSLEDTAFYRYHRQSALNEVGGNPDATALSVDAFHAEMQARAREWPRAMTATATHDTKRGEDARARVMSLLEIPDEWGALVARWKTFNAPLITSKRDMRAPSAAFEYMIYQALVGSWSADDPSFSERFKAYVCKAAREGKQETSWLNPNADYEAGLIAFVERILDRSISAEFLESLEQLAQRAALLGALNSLSQLTLKAAVPGVPDFYQGTEFWDLSMVDPDNRRKVDFAERSAALEAMQTPEWSALVREWPNGRLKLAWTHRLLELRRAQSEVFEKGEYHGLQVVGPDRNHIIAFARRHRHEAVIVAVARSMAPFTDRGRTWPRGDSFSAAIDIQDYRLPDQPGARNELPVSQLFSAFPAAVLQAQY